MIKVKALASDRAQILIHGAIGQDWYGDGVTSERVIRQLEALGDVTDIDVQTAQLVNVSGEHHSTISYKIVQL